MEQNPSVTATQNPSITAPNTSSTSPAKAGVDASKPYDRHVILRFLSLLKENASNLILGKGIPLKYVLVDGSQVKLANEHSGLSVPSFLVSLNHAIRKSLRPIGNFTLAIINHVIKMLKAAQFIVPAALVMLSKVNLMFQKTIAYPFALISTAIDIFNAIKDFNYFQDQTTYFICQNKLEKLEKALSKETDATRKTKITQDIDKVREKIKELELRHDKIGERVKKHKLGLLGQVNKYNVRSLVVFKSQEIFCQFLLFSAFAAQFIKLFIGTIKDALIVLNLINVIAFTYTGLRGLYFSIVDFCAISKLESWRRELKADIVRQFGANTPECLENCQLVDHMIYLAMKRRSWTFKMNVLNCISGLVSVLPGSLALANESNVIINLLSSFFTFFTYIVVDVFRKTLERKDAKEVVSSPKQKINDQKEFEKISENLYALCNQFINYSRSAKAKEIIAKLFITEPNEVATDPKANAPSVTTEKTPTQVEHKLSAQEQAYRATAFKLHLINDRLGFDLSHMLFALKVVFWRAPKASDLSSRKAQPEAAPAAA